jgi:hypothetical protein
VSSSPFYNDATTPISSELTNRIAGELEQQPLTGPGFQYSPVELMEPNPVAASPASVLHSLWPPLHHPRSRHRPLRLERLRPRPRAGLVPRLQGCPGAANRLSRAVDGGTQVSWRTGATAISR